MTSLLKVTFQAFLREFTEGFLNDCSQKEALTKNPVLQYIGYEKLRFADDFAKAKGCEL